MPEPKPIASAMSRPMAVPDRAFPGRPGIPGLHGHGNVRISPRDRLAGPPLIGTGLPDNPLPVPVFGARIRLDVWPSRYHRPVRGGSGLPPGRSTDRDRTES